MKMLEDLAEVVQLDDAACPNYAAALMFIRTHHATIRDMAARMEAAERDAERYKAVRSGDFGVHARIERGEATEFAYDDDLDQAIDAAMQETGR
jgi:methenyltetrahydromethanopterin cyclohydrolase